MPEKFEDLPNGVALAELGGYGDGPYCARHAYHSGLFKKYRERYIEIYHQLKTEPVGPRRSQLVKEGFAMNHLDFEER